MYYFLSGYTAKVAGTERGITEPVATFSACFGEAFLPLHPTVYAKLLGEKIDKHGVNVYLVNTGWTGGKYGVGKRMSIKDTRACINAILDGSINKSEFDTTKTFRLQVPKTLGDINLRYSTQEMHGATKRLSMQQEILWQRCLSKTLRSTKKRIASLITLLQDQK